MFEEFQLLFGIAIFGSVLEKYGMQRYYVPEMIGNWIATLPQRPYQWRHRTNNSNHHT